MTGRHRAKKLCLSPVRTSWYRNFRRGTRIFGPWYPAGIERKKSKPGYFVPQNMQKNIKPEINVSVDLYFALFVSLSPKELSNDLIFKT